jgi:hypothetical protein
MNNEELHPREKPAFDPDKHQPQDDLEQRGQPANASPATRYRLAATLAAFGSAMLLYKVLVGYRQLRLFRVFHPDASLEVVGLGHTSLMFMGVPLILCVLLALTPPARTDAGRIVKGITLALLIAAPLLGEGYLCILIASPLFYTVGLAVSGILHWIGIGRRRTRVSCAALIMLPFCLEGTVPQMTFPRAQTIAATRVIAAPAADVQTALAQPLHVDTPLPTFLRIGFPRPLASWGSGLRVGDSRGVHFTGAETAPPGDLRLRITESRPGFVRFAAEGDSSKLTEWMRWRSSEVSWHAIDPKHTEVTWQVQFDRGLDPAWYFGPWERAAVEEAADYLIRANATPVGSR